MSKLQAVSRKVIVTIDPPKKLSSGLIIPESYDSEEIKTGTIVSVGDEAKELKPNQKILFHTQSGYPFKYDGVNYKILKQEDVIAIL